MFILRSSLASFLAAVVFLQPAVAYAVFTTPSELLQASGGNNRSPTSFSLSAEGNVEGHIYVKMQLTGASERADTLSALKARAHFSLDIQSEEFGMQMNAQAVAYQKMAYIRINALKGHGATWSELSSKVSPYVGQWISAPIPLSDAEYSSLEEQQRLASPDSEQVAQVIDRIFSLQHKRFSSGHAYLLQLREDGIEQLLSLVGELPNAPLVTSDLLQKLQLKIKVDTNTRHEPQYISFDVAFAHEQEPRMHFKTTMTSQRQLTPVYVEVPKKSVTWSSLKESLAPSLQQIDGDSEESSEQVQEPQQAIDLSIAPGSSANLHIVDLVGPSGRRVVRVPVQIGTPDGDLRDITRRTGVLYIEQEPGVVEFHGPVASSLEVLFFDASGKFLRAGFLEPCSDDCVPVRSPRNTKYTLQVLPGFIVQHSIRLGWRILLHDDLGEYLSPAVRQGVSRMRLQGARELHRADRPAERPVDDAVAPEHQRLVVLGKIIGTQIRTADLRSLTGKERATRAEFVTIAQQLKDVRIKNPWLHELFIVRPTSSTAVQIVVDSDMAWLKEAIPRAQDTWMARDIAEHPDRVVSFSVIDDAGVQHTYVYVPMIDAYGAVMGGVVLE